MTDDPKPSTYRKLPAWVRGIITFVVIIVAASVWGFLATVMGAPSIVTAIGAVLIGGALFTQLSGEDE